MKFTLRNPGQFEPTNGPDGKCRSCLRGVDLIPTRSASEVEMAEFLAGA